MTEHAEYKYDAFISYSHADRAWVWDELLPRLEGAGLRVCIDDRDFEIGVPSLVNVERAVDNSRHTLVVLTPAWIESQWTEFESLLAGTADPAGRRRKLIPLMLKSCKQPSRIAMLTYADFTRLLEREAQMTRLVRSLGSATETLSHSELSRQRPHAIAPPVRLPDLQRSNPFIVGPAIRDPARFYGRQAELRAIAGRVGAVSAQSISIVGERRIGKSSLLWQVKNQAETLFRTGHRYEVLFLDLSGAAGRSNRMLMRTLRRELNRVGLPVWEKRDDGDLAVLSYALEELDATAQDVRLVLCLDEFEYVNDRPAEFDGLLEELRAEAQLGRLALVTASCTPLADLCAQGRIEVSPFFNIFTQVELGPLDEDSWRALVRAGLGEVSDADWRFIEECAGRHPFLTQMAAALLWEVKQVGAVDYIALRAEFERQAEPHRAYWLRKQKENV
jgi:hypothetical protein